MIIRRLERNLPLYVALCSVFIENSGFLFQGFSVFMASFLSCSVSLESLRRYVLQSVFCVCLCMYVCLHIIEFPVVCCPGCYFMLLCTSLDIKYLVVFIPKLESMTLLGLLRFRVARVLI